MFYDIKVASKVQGVPVTRVIRYPADSAEAAAGRIKATLQKRGEVHVRVKSCFPVLK